MPESAPVIVERSAPGIEVELIGGRRVRFERDLDADGEVIGSVGVSGDSSDNDAACAVAGIEAAGLTADDG